jgi:hypothetical protein
MFTARDNRSITTGMIPVRVSSYAASLLLTLPLTLSGGLPLETRGSISG